MRILFDQAVYDLRNKGNVAILQAAVTRLHNMWPSASLEVITLAPHLLRLYFPNACPVSPDGSYDWVEHPTHFDRIASRLPKPILRSLFELRQEIWRRWPTLTLGQIKQTISPWLQRHVEHQVSELNDSITEHVDAVKDKASHTQAVDGIHLFVATGGQYMSDVVRDNALQLLDRLEVAVQRGIPTVMVGQGLGPLEDQDLWARSREVLPQVDLILIREKKFAPSLLNSLGVSPDRVFLTGDDAIEMAYEARTNTFGTGIGVGIRMAHYTEIHSAHLESIRLALHDTSSKYGAKLISVPISHSTYEFEYDDQVIRQVSAGQKNVSHSWQRFASPLETIKRVGRCRLVVSGAFHTAVFALAQGIPAVCLARSALYANKFLGLADQFGRGCEVVFLDDNHLQEKLTFAIDSAWHSAQQVRPQLLEAALCQIDWGHTGYRRIYDLVASMNRDAPPGLARV